MAARKKENPLLLAAQEILKVKGVNFNDWKKEIIDRKKLAIMSDQDKEWTERTLEEAALEVLTEQVTSGNFALKEIAASSASERNTLTSI